MADLAALAQSKALLLVEDNVDEAFSFSRALRAARPDCELYTVPGVVAAQRTLMAASTDGDCMPGAVFVSLELAADAGTGLVRWMREQPHLRNCPVFGLASDEATEVDGVNAVLRTPVRSEAIVDALSRTLAPGCTVG